MSRFDLVASVLQPLAASMKELGALLRRERTITTPRSPEGSIRAYYHHATLTRGQYTARHSYPQSLEAAQSLVSKLFRASARAT